MVKDKLEKYAYFEPIKHLIPLVEKKMRDQSINSHKYLDQALNHLLDSGGKRIRSGISLLVSSMLGVDQEKQISLAAAVEMLHTATLVHDDLIDGAMIRRGNPTLNSKWSTGAALLTGDYLFARAARLASETDSIATLTLFSDKLSIIVNGEVGQLFNKRGHATLEEYYEKIYAKTASLFELAAIGSAHLGETDVDDQNLLESYGYNIGMAFQIVDDILDYTGDQAKVGKPIVSDLRQGLVTLPAIFYLEEKGGDNRFDKYVVNDEEHDGEMDGLIDDILKSGAVDKAIEKAREFTNEGLKTLEKFADCTEKEALINLAISNVDRKY